MLLESWLRIEERGRERWIGLIKLFNADRWRLLFLTIAVVPYVEFIRYLYLGYLPYYRVVVESLSFPQFVGCTGFFLLPSLQMLCSFGQFRLPKTHPLINTLTVVVGLTIMYYIWKRESWTDTP